MTWCWFDRSQTQIFSSPTQRSTTRPNYWEKPVKKAYLQYPPTQQQAIISVFPSGHWIAQMELLTSFMKALRVFFFSLPFLPLLVRPRSMFKVWTKAAFLPFESNFSSIWISRISAYLVWNIFCKTHLRTLSESPHSCHREKEIQRVYFF